MTRPLNLVAGALLGALSLSDLPAQAGGTYLETFNTTTHKDAVNTTAFWDTGTGELKLPPFVPLLVGSYNTPGEAFSVAVAGDLAFVADYASGLQIINITNLASPSLVGTYNTTGLAFDVAVAGDLAFVADEASGLQIINITNPASPTLAGSYNTTGFSIGVAVAGNLAFVADAFDGVHILNVANPALPTFIKTYDTPGVASRVAVSGNLLFVADDASGLHIVNVTDPLNPLLAGTYDTPGQATEVAVTGDLALVADAATGLLIININNPASPTLVGTYNTPGLAVGVEASGDVAFVADDALGLQIVDITNAASPTLAHSFDTPGNALGVAVAGEHTFVADGLSGLQVVKSSERTKPQLVGAFGAVVGPAGGIAVTGDLALVAEQTGLRIFDITDPASPVLVGAYGVPAIAWDVAVDGNFAFLGRDDGRLEVIDITNPASPVLVSAYDTPGSSRGVAVDGDHAFVADVTAFRIIDVSNPASPVLAGTYIPPNSVLDVAVAGDLAFLAVFDVGLQIVNITNAAAPALVGAFSMSGYNVAVAVAGDLAFLVNNYGLQIIDITNPASPSFVGTYGSLSANDIAVSGDLVFLADYTRGLEVVDITIPASPVLVDSHPGPALNVTVAGEHVAYDAGLVEVFNHQLYTYNDTGQSLTVNPIVESIVAVRLQTTQSAGVTWEIGANNPSVWQAITPDNQWNAVDVDGVDLRWRSTHRVTTPGVNPTVTDLQIDWMGPFPAIDAITDIPNDQGGWVRVRVDRSGRDIADTSAPLPIAHYGLWRRVDSAALASALASAPRDLEALDPAIVAAFGAMPIFGYDGRVYAQSGPAEPNAALPPGTWALITTIPALQQPTYLADVPTLADSTVEGIYHSVFVVTAHTTTPLIWYASEPDSGYSVDNIAPGVPTSFAIAYNTGSGNTLSWDPSLAEDFQYFRVYRSTDPAFTPSSGTLVHATATTGWSDPDYDGWAVYYKVTALDHAGNESDPATAGSVTGIGGIPVPERAALYQNHPNPFNPTTQIRYDVPRGGADVRLAIYDVSGRRVRELLSGRETEGEKSIRWDARDDAGVLVATGIYFCRVTIGGFAATRKMVLLK